MNTLLTTWIPVVLGQAAAGAANGSDTASSVQVQSVWDFVVNRLPSEVRL